MTPLEGLEKEDQISDLQANTYHLKKIGPVDPEITGLQEIIRKYKKRELTQAKHTGTTPNWPNKSNNNQHVWMLVNTGALICVCYNRNTK